MTDVKRLTDANRAVWNHWTATDRDSQHHRDAARVRAGGSSLRSIERDVLGDVAGKSLLHLQCNMGSDTLSWARLGAHVTGVDISDNAIEAARARAHETGIAAEFIRADVYDLPDVLTGEFDIVVSTYGTIGFLPDLQRWAQIVARYLRPGGTFLLVEIHPQSLAADVSHVDQPRQDKPQDHRDSTNVTLGRAAETSMPAQIADDLTLYTWVHPVEDVASALASAGLRMQSVREFPFTFWQAFPALVLDDEGWWRWPDAMPGVTLLYAIRATR